MTVTAQEIFFAMDWASFFWGAETSVHVHAVLVAGSGVDFFCFEFFQRTVWGLRESVSGWAGISLGFRSTLLRTAAVFVPWIQICTVILEHRDRAAVRDCQYESNAHLNLQYKTRSKPPS